MNKIEVYFTGVLTSSISVIMPTYNTKDYISEFIETILNQTFHDFELIVIDDGFTDNSVKIVELYHNSRIILQKNRT